MTEWLSEQPPNPISPGEGVDLRDRWGTLTPLDSKLHNSYPGVSVDPAQTLTVTNAAQRLPRSSPALSALVQVQTAAIRWTSDGSTPSATVGFRADPGSMLRVTGPQDLLAFQMIRETATDATVVVGFYS